MAAQQPKDPLDVLQHTFNEYLVNTGKALRASHKNGPRSVASTAGAINSKMADTMKTYHHALDDLESEITRAKAVLLRDLEKLQAARMPIREPTPPPPPPPPQPVAPPAPMMEDVKQPAAVMLEMPSTAAHTVNPNMGFEVAKEETKRVAPFPDMGMGLAADVVDLTSGGGDVKSPPPATAVAAPVTASPRVPPPGGIKTGPMGARATPPVKQSPKPTPPMATKATPTGASAPSAKTNPASAASAPVPDNNNNVIDITMGGVPPPPSAGPTGGAAMADMTGGELNFTNMEFTLAPTPTEGQGAPPAPMAPMAPMQDFDLSSFATQGDGGNDLLSMDSFGTGPADVGAGGAPGAAMGSGAGAAGAGNNNNNAAVAPPQSAAAAAAPEPPQPTTTTESGPAAGDASATDSANIDSLFDLGSAGGDNMDLDLNLSDGGGMGGMGENSFNDLFMPDGDMDQFDEQYFQLE